MAYVNWNFTVRFDRNNTRKPRDLIDDILRAPLNEAYRRILSVGQKIGDLEQILCRVDQEQ